VSHHDDELTGPRSVEPLQERQEVGKSFAGAGRGVDDGVLAAEEPHHGGLLDRRRPSDAHAAQGGRSRVAERQVTEYRRRCAERFLRHPRQWPAAEPGRERGEHPRADCGGSMHGRRVSHRRTLERIFRQQHRYTREPPKKEHAW